MCIMYLQCVQSQVGSQAVESLRPIIYYSHACVHVSTSLFGIPSMGVDLCTSFDRASSKILASITTNFKIIHTVQHICFTVCQFDGCKLLSAQVYAALSPNLFHNLHLLVLLWMWNCKHYRLQKVCNLQDQISLHTWRLNSFCYSPQHLG